MTDAEKLQKAIKTLKMVRVHCPDTFIRQAADKTITEIETQERSE